MVKCRAEHGCNALFLQKAHDKGLTVKACFRNIYIQIEGTVWRDKGKAIATRKFGAQQIAPGLIDSLHSIDIIIAVV